MIAFMMLGKLFLLSFRDGVTDSENVSSFFICGWKREVRGRQPIASVTAVPYACWRASRGRVNYCSESFT
jgi:hypothetical protein